MIAQALRQTEAAVLCYSVRDRASFRLALGLAEFMRESFSSSSSSSSPDATAAMGSSPEGRRGAIPDDDDDDDDDDEKGRVYPVVLVGTRCDFLPPQEEEERAVPFAEGLKAAQGMKMPGDSVSDDVPFLEVSAKTGEGVERVFHVVGEEVLRARRMVRARREQAERERMMLDLREITKTGGAAEGGRKRFSWWRALAVAFRRRRALVGR
jgi:GTPase SAR1 family protein